MSLRFNVALVGHFLADYAVLYFVIARAQAAGGAKGAVWTFLATSLPAIGLFLLAPLWDRMQRRPLRSLGLVQGTVLVATLSLFALRSLPGTLTVALLLGFTRQLFRLLLSACAKGATDPSVRHRLLERSITLRYACMIPGATIGAFAGGSSWETIVVGAAATMTALSLVLLQSDRELGAYRLHHETTSLPQLPNARMLGDAFGRRELWVFLWTTIAVSCFMAVEYPLLTETYGFQRWMLPVVWGGHLFGSLAANLPRILRAEEHLARRLPIIGGLGLIAVLAFGTFAVLPAWVVPASLLMAGATLVLCRFEIAVGKRLLERVGEARFATVNLQMRGFELALQIVGPAGASLGVAALTVRGTLGIVCFAAFVAVLPALRPADSVRPS